MSKRWLSYRLREWWGGRNMKATAQKAFSILVLVMVACGLSFTIAFAAEGDDPTLGATPLQPQEDGGGSNATSVSYLGGGTETDPYIISSAEEWNELAATPEHFDMSFKLGEDITVSTMVGMADQPFTGTFDGDGHTLTFNLETAEAYAAPFRYVTGNATFKNLVVDGTITTSAQYAAGVVALVQENTANAKMTFENIKSTSR